MRTSATPSRRGAGSRYQPALDGVRGLAIGLVIAYHFGAGWARGGFLGVDVFLTLSGYFVTRMLLSEWSRHRRLDLGAFWASRLRRLVPVLGLVTLAVAGWAYFGADPVRLTSIRLDALWAIVFGSNWHFIVGGQSYFDLYSAPSPFRHTWMLATIVQLYVVWPLVMIACLRLARGGRRAVGIVAIVGTVASAALLATLYNPVDPSRAYYGTDTRASQFLIGALLAVVLAGRSIQTTAGRRGLQTVGIGGAIGAVTLVAIASDRDGWLYRGGFLAMALATAAVIAALVLGDRALLQRALSLRPLVWVGAISYGLYLWHWPVKVILTSSRVGLEGWQLTLVWVAATIALAVPSYYLVERPIRRGARIRPRWMRVLAPTALAITALAVIGATAGAKTPPEFLTAPQGSVLHRAPPPTVATSAPAPALRDTPTRWLLVGDSTAASLGDALQAEARARGLSLTSETRPGCGVITGIATFSNGTEVPWGRKCNDQTPRYLQNAVQDASPEVVLWLSTWESGNRIVDGVFYAFGTPSSDAMLLTRFEETRAALTADGARLVILTTPPNAAENQLGVRDRSLERRVQHLNELLRTFGWMHRDSVTVVDFDRLICPSGPPCPAAIDGVVLRPRDGAHFEGDGPAWVAPRLLDLVVEALP